MIEKSVLDKMEPNTLIFLNDHGYYIKGKKGQWFEVFVQALDPETNMEFVYKYQDDLECIEPAVEDLVDSLLVSSPFASLNAVVIESEEESKTDLRTFFNVEAEVE